MAEENVQVGKYTLESLTTGMYSDPYIESIFKMAWMPWKMLYQ